MDARYSALNHPEILDRLEALAAFKGIDVVEGEWPGVLDSLDRAEVLAEIFDVTGIMLENVRWSSIQAYTDLQRLLEATFRLEESELDT